MAKFVYKDAFISVNGVDLSLFARQVEVTTGAADVESTTMGASGVGRIGGGLRDEKFVVTWAQDFASAKVDATLWPLYSGGTSHVVIVRPTSAEASSTNPAFTGTCYLLDYVPLAGKTGDLAEATSTFVVNGVLTHT